MSPLKIFSIIFLITGAFLFAIGIYIYWVTNPTPTYINFFILFGLSIILISIILLCLSQQS